MFHLKKWDATNTSFSLKENYIYGQPICFNRVSLTVVYSKREPQKIRLYRPTLFVDCYLYLTKILRLVDIPCNVIEMEIVSYPRGKVRRCFQGILITALFYNKGTSFFYLFIHFYVTLEKRPLITKGDFSNHRSSESQI